MPFHLALPGLTFTFHLSPQRLGSSQVHQLLAAHACSQSPSGPSPCAGQSAGPESGGEAPCPAPRSWCGRKARASRSFIRSQLHKQDVASLMVGAEDGYKWGERQTGADEVRCGAEKLGCPLWWLLFFLSSRRQEAGPSGMGVFRGGGEWRRKVATGVLERGQERRHLGTAGILEAHCRPSP